MNTVLLHAQTSSSKAGDTVVYNKVYEFVELRPEFPGGEQEMYDFIFSHIHYPSDSCSEYEGKLFIKFIVDTAGNVRKPKVVRGLCGSMDSIALNMIYEMPKWKPGKQNGKPVNVYYTIPVQFRADKVDKHDAVYPGGTAALSKYLHKNLKYPSEAKKNWISGTVFIIFEVNEDGSISNITIGKGIGGGCDEEAIRLISEMPAWTPAMENGKKISSYVSLQIEFEL